VSPVCFRIDLALECRADLTCSSLSLFSGLDNSGKFGTIAWASNSSNVDRSINALELLTAEVTKSDYKGVVKALSRPPSRLAFVAQVSHTDFRIFIPLLAQYRGH